MSRYEVTWNNGHVEFIEADTVIVPYPDPMRLDDQRDKIRFLRNDGERPATLLLAVTSNQIVSVRNLTEMENEAPQ